MGAICSKSSDHSGGHTVLSSSGDVSVGGRHAPITPASGPVNKPDPRQAAAGAAEARAQAVCNIFRFTSRRLAQCLLASQQAQSRGTNAKNPKKGKLAAQLEEANRAKRVPEQREEERIVVSWLFIALLQDAHGAVRGFSGIERNN